MQETVEGELVSFFDLPGCELLANALTLVKCAHCVIKVTNYILQVALYNVMTYYTQP